MNSNTPFKTPLPFRTPRSEQKKGPPKGERLFSDSEGSTASSEDNNVETASTPSSNGEISLVAEFDDLTRIRRRLKFGNMQLENSFLDLVQQLKQMYILYFQAVEECHRLQSVLDGKVHECSDLEHKLTKARKLMGQEKHNIRDIRKEIDDLAMQIAQIRDVLFGYKGTTSRLSEDLKHKLSFRHNTNKSHNDFYNHNLLSAIKEVNSTGSILSDFSYSRSEDDLDSSLMQAGKAWKKHRPSTGGVAEPATKKRRSSDNKAVEIGPSDTVRAATTLTVTKDGPITATSIIESIPKTPSHEQPITNGELPSSAPPSNLVFESWARGSAHQEKKANLRQHSFQQKMTMTPTTCNVCDKRINFGETSLKCKECKYVCHVECKDNLPLPCIPSMNTPTQRDGLGLIGDHTPTTPPMIPALLIHCINEIELRGLTELSVYRIPCAERDVKALKEKFLKGRGAPSLNQVDIHVICGTVKDFLRSLREPILTYGLRKQFVQAVEMKNPADTLAALYKVISELPRPNRDTLGYIILHLQKVAEAKECKVNVSNLTKIFGPIMVGYSSDDLNPKDILNEVAEQIKVMENLLIVPSEYWADFVNVESTRHGFFARPTTTKGFFSDSQ